MVTDRPHWSSQTKLVITLLLLILITYLGYRFGLVIAPFILALILAYILGPIANFLHHRLRLARTPAILLGYLLLILVLSTLPLIFIPMLTSQMADMNVDFQDILLQVETLLGRQYRVMGQVIDTAVLLEQFADALRTLVEPVMGQTFEILFDIISSVVWLIFITVVSFYLVRDGDDLRLWIEGLVPPAYAKDYFLLRNEISTIWSAFFRGQIVLSLVVATGVSIVAFILGLPFALGMGVLAGLLELLPSIGHGIWLALASLLALFAGSTWLPIPHWAFALLLIGLHVIFQQFDLNYLIPRIIGRSVHLHPLVVILGIVSGALLGGVLGILLAAPTIASARVIGRYVYANLFDLDPFPDHTSLTVLPPPNPYWWRKSRRL